METFIGKAVILLTIAMIVAVIARRIKLPYTIGLVVVGALLSLTKLNFGLHLTHDLIFNLILPPLLFEAALAIPWRELRQNAGSILSLAVVGTLVSAAVVTGGMVWGLGWPVEAAVVFGALIAATDPVAIIAMFKDNNIHGRMRLLVESESLMNDGVAAVLFTVALAWAVSGGSEPVGVETLGTLGRIVLGGIAVGAICGGLAIMVAGRSTEYLVETALTAIAAYGSFIIAEHFHVSGVLATVTAGLMMGNMGLLAEGQGSYLTNKGREAVESWWEFAAFLANSAVFLLIGIDIAALPYKEFSMAMLAGAVVLVLASRAVAVYPLGLALGKTRWKLSVGEKHVLWWGGLRGALGLALALSLPVDMPLRDEILVATFVVVGFSIIVQGLTMPVLLKRLGYVG